MPSVRYDSALQTAPAGLAILIEDDDGCDVPLGAHRDTSSEWSPLDSSGERGGKQRDRRRRRSSAIRKHFAQYTQQQEMTDGMELGWDCGICFETAEDPCVTRCGHLYCQSHLNHWLSSHPSCPVCKALCTPSQDVVPIFSRGRISPTSSPSISPRTTPSPSPDQQSGSPVPMTPQRHSISAPIPPHSGPPQSTVPSDSVACPTPTSHPPHPLVTSYVLAHYLGIALRLLGFALLLAVLLR